MFRTKQFINPGTVGVPMRIDELDVPDSVAEALMAAGFRELHPPQAEAIPLTLEGGNLVAAIPTASGKSLIDGKLHAASEHAEPQGDLYASTPGHLADLLVSIALIHRERR